MLQIFYTSLLVASLICAAIYIYMWHKHFDVNLTMVFTLIPITCLGYVMSTHVTTLDGALLAQQVIYIGGSFLQLFIGLTIFNLCQIRISKLGRLILFGICAVVYSSVLTIGHLKIFYTKVDFEMVEGKPNFIREYGIMHTIFYAMVGLFLLAGIATIVYSWLRNKEIPRRILLLLFIPDIVCVFAYFVLLKLLSLPVDLVPFVYVFAEVIYIMIAYRVSLYNVSDTVIDSYVQEQKVGYVSFDFKYRYLGSNSIAKELVPELKELAVDEKFGEKPEHKKILHFLDSFREDQKNNVFIYADYGDPTTDEDDRFFNANVNFLYDGNRKRGYIITFIDDTANRKYISLIDSYNDDLKKEVEEKTKHIVEMHDNLIMSLAMMVESRDNSTGGHILRTSEGVRILVDEIKKSGKMNLSDEFCADIIKAAPMHDLGKIAVDDAVLRKPGRFTDEEYEKMKKHAEEGAKVIHKVLLHTDDKSFKIVAENVAHYHHERWDGSGYPEKISGEQIPLEARIMAIADVYDALVSKRVYKDSFSFEKADSIIMEGMGTQFDPALKEIYEKARPRLEAYYAGLEE